MLYYCPVERYKSRYTWQLRKWMTRNWNRAGVNYTLIDNPQMLGKDATNIETGAVLDCFTRSRFAMRQIDQILDLIENGMITSYDVIYLEDFFHPGAEAIPYCCSLKGISPKVYAYWWAQSVDVFDFTRTMRDWMSWHEMSQLSWMDGIFVACPSMKKEIMRAYQGYFPNWLESKIHVVGLPFDSEEVLSRTPTWYQQYLRTGWDQGTNSTSQPRKNQVVFSSRWDKEKNPNFFCEVARLVIEKMPDAKFVVCTGAPELRSNDPGLKFAADNIYYFCPNNFSVKTDLTKEQYYHILSQSKVQFNCADQDWVSFTLLEASVCGCYPIYPNFRSFPETLGGREGQNYLYTHKNINEAVSAVLWALREPQELWSPGPIQARSWIHRRFDLTWARMLLIMGVVHQDMKGTLMNTLDPFNNGAW